ncbi:MAG: S8 family serine peptidase [Chloroflexi bacterium]|nr:S8 family serine peptidase [Chloroflexota bacterium]
MRYFLSRMAVLAMFVLGMPSESNAFSNAAALNDLTPRGLTQRAVSAKIERAVLEALQKGEPTRALIVMAEQADVSAAENLPTKQAKGAFVFNTLRGTAQRTQAGVRADLERRGASYRAYSVANVIAVENLDAQVAAQIAARSEVGRIAANPDVKFAEPVPVTPSTEAARAIEWNIKKIGADQVWSQKIRGQGIVVANQDTGVEWDHPALKKKYRGYAAKTDTVNHSYNWWDAIHSSITGGGNPCGFNSAAPCDDTDHGTHTMGTLVGSTSTNKIGVAPRAKWIACRNMDNGVGRPSTYIECFDFFLAPWDAAGNNPDPNQAPDVVSNSWGCPPSELCTPDSLQTATRNLRLAGIFVSVSAGNSGSNCSTISDPSGIYNASTTVGATDSGDSLASFSSRGPITIDGSNRRKPDISAPGVSVRSSVPGGGYSQMSGTSMAAPHVAGAVALLWRAKPNLRGNVKATEKVLFKSAYRKVQVGNQNCGGTDENDIPNNLFGWGRLDVWNASRQAP